MFTQDSNASCVHVTPWEHLGESWPYFRPNFVNMERAQEEHGADEVRMCSCVNMRVEVVSQYGAQTRCAL